MSRTADIPIEKISQMQRVGFWWSKDEPDLPNPKAFIDKTWNKNERGKVITYLEESYHVPYFQCGASWCRLCIFNKTPSDIGTQDLTDGTWLYPEGFVHYIRKHKVKPPEDFLAHVRNNNYRVPKLEISESTSQTFYDLPQTTLKNRIKYYCFMILIAVIIAFVLAVIRGICYYIFGVDYWELIWPQRG